jgi:ABC-type polysaccharide/polyol phosphate export permease
MKKSVVSDFCEALLVLPLAIFFAWGDTKARYRRSVLGPLWIVFGTAIGVAGLGFLWSSILRVDKHEFIPSLTLGLVVWQFIAGCITESSLTYIHKASLIKNIRMPYFIFPIQVVLRQLINFLHNFIVVIVVLCIFPPNLGFAQILFIPGLILLLGNLLWIVSLVGLLGARFRDLEQFVNAFMPIVFFLSPVIYPATRLGAVAKFVWLNPFSYMITLIRDPVQGNVPELFVYIWAFVFLVFGWLFTFWIYGKKRNRLAFWV